MTASLVLACLWVVAAALAAMLPSRRGHWPAAWALAAVGVPLLGLVTYQNGPWIGLVAMFAGASILRWPLWRLWDKARERPRCGVPVAAPAEDSRV